MRSIHVIPLMIGLWALGSISQAQQILFDDSFDLDPGANGWVENIVTTGTATGTITNAGTAAEIDKTGGTGRVEGTITRFFDTRGFSDITLELLAFQSATDFEGGAYRGFNNDSLSIFIDTGGGFVPLMQRTGVWGASGLGLSDGGDGAGNTVSTSTGTLAAGIAAANISNFGVRIEGIVWAGPESYFLDQFFLRGQLAAAAAGPDVVISDLGAINSFFFSGLPAVAALADSNLSALQFSRRDINERLFRLQTNSPDAEPKALESTLVSAPDEIPEELTIESANSWQWFAKSDFGESESDTLSTGTATSANFHSGTMGFEYSGAKTWAAGAAWTYLESDSDLPTTMPSSLDLEGHQMHTYLSWLPNEATFLSLLYTYSALDNQLMRNTGLGDVALGSTTSKASTISMDGGFRFQMGKVTTGPIGGFDLTSATIDGFSETGSPLGAMNVQSQDYDSLISHVGWQISNNISAGRALVTPQVRIAWEREHESARNVSASLRQSPFYQARGGTVIGSTGGLASTISQAQSGRDYLSAGAGLRVIVDNTWTVSLDYEGQFFRSNSSAHFGGIRFSATY